MRTGNGTGDSAHDTGEIIPDAVVEYLLDGIFHDGGFNKFVIRISCGIVPKYVLTDAIASVICRTYAVMKRKLTSGDLHCTRSVSSIEDVTPHCMNTVIRYSCQVARSALTPTLREMSRYAENEDFLKEEYYRVGKDWTMKDEDLDPEETAKLISIVHACLSPREREIIQYRLNGLDPQEISELTNLKPSTVNRYRSAAEKKCREVHRRFLQD